MFFKAALSRAILLNDTFLFVIRKTLSWTSILTFTATLFVTTGCFANADHEQAVSSASDKLQKLGIYPSVWEFIEYVKKNDAAIVRLFLEAGADPTAKENNGRSALYYAVINQNMSMLELLLPKVKDVAPWLPMVAYQGDSRVFDLFLAYVKEPDQELLHKTYLSAAAGAELQILKTLAAKYTDLKNLNSEALLEATDNETRSEERAQAVLATVKYLMESGASANVKDDFGNTPLILAAYNNQSEVIVALLASGADINVITEGGYSALFAAIDNHHDQSVEVLLDMGADINVVDHTGRSVLIAAIDRRIEFVLQERIIDKVTSLNHVCNSCEVAGFSGGITPLLAAAIRDKQGLLVKKLIDKGADYQAKTQQGITTLMLASRYSSDRSVKVLLDAGVDVNAVDKKGLSALIYSSMLANRYAVLQLLLQYGANANGTDHQGLTVLMHAARDASGPMVEALIDAGAQHQVRDKDGYMAVDLAARRGNYEAYHILLPLKEGKK